MGDDHDDHDDALSAAPDGAAPDGAAPDGAAPDGATPWTVAAATVRGVSHEAEGTDGQDAHAVQTRGGWLVAVVCDGAGSTALGGLGAAVGARTVAETLALACGDAPPGAPVGHEAFWRKAATDAVMAARDAVAHALQKTPGGTDDRGLPLFERAHATLVAAVAGPDGGFFAHVGDGLGIALHAGEARATSLPENGDYANETFFFTEPGWDGHLRLTPFDAPVDRVVLMSDGGMSLAIKDGALFAGFAGPVGRYLDTVGGTAGSAALAETLRDPRTHAVTGDDKTVVWARLGGAIPAEQPAGQTAAMPAAEPPALGATRR